MWELRNSRLHFVLIDFDMATVVSHRSNQPYVPSSKHRTGTLAFMAVDLIRDAARAAQGDPDYVAIPHLLCHDYESIFWLCYWCMLVLLAVDEHARTLLLDVVRAWETSEFWVLSRSKAILRVDAPDDEGIYLPPAAHSAGLYDWHAVWLTFWFDVDKIMRPHRLKRAVARNHGQDIPTIDYETAGGLITRDNLRARLTAVLPDTSDQPLSEELLNKLAGITVETSSSRDDHHGSEPGPAQPTAAKSPKPKRPSKANATNRRKGAASKKSDTAARKPRTARKVAVSPKKTAVRKARRAKTPPNDAEVNDIRNRLRPRK